MEQCDIKTYIVEKIQKNKFNKNFKKFQRFNKNVKKKSEFLYYFESSFGFYNGWCRMNKYWPLWYRIAGSPVVRSGKSRCMWLNYRSGIRVFPAVKYPLCPKSKLSQMKTRLGRLCRNFSSVLAAFLQFHHKMVLKKPPMCGLTRWSCWHIGMNHLPSLKIRCGAGDFLFLFRINKMS